MIYPIFFNSLIVAALLTPIIRFLAIRLNILDHPVSDVKTHTNATPYLGGLAIMIGIVTSILIYNGIYDPSSELLSWRFFAPLFSLFILGTMDDIMGFSARFRFLVQFTCYGGLLYFLNIHIPITGNVAFDHFFTLIWLVGITNAFNIIDIMDGLSSGVAIIVATTIAIFGALKGQVGVILLGLATAGSCLGFIGFNFSKKHKIFMGDGGSTLLGSIVGIASVILCYHSKQVITDFTALFILCGIPIYDTLLVMILRIKKGISPFKGSRDHFALRMVEMGFSRIQTVISAYIVTLALALVAFVIHYVNDWHAILLLSAVGLFGITWGRMLSIIDVGK